jgi:hypothetical protein
MKITVTQQHIDQGQKGSPTRDPIAFAMADAGLESPNAGVTHLRWYKDGRRQYVEVPREVYDFMLNFDTGRAVKPFEFQIMDEGCL